MDDYDGKITFKNGVQYNGAIENGNIHGKGKIVFINGIVYEGEFHSNRIEGKGRLEYSPTEVYEGNFVNFDKTGFGKYENQEEGIKYEGDWINNQFNGSGELTKKDCWIYKGEFKNNQKDGYGEIQYLNSKSFYKGEFKNGQKSGKGEMNWAKENNNYNGEWQSNMVHGFGVYTYRDSLDAIRFVHNIYVGPFEYNTKAGLGFHIFSDGSMLSGRWLQGVKEGPFIYRDRFGHFFLKNFEQNHLKTTKSIKTDNSRYYIADETLPKINLIRGSKNEDIWANILKSYVGALKDLYKETIEEIIKNRDKDRQIFCLNLQEVIQIFKNYRLFDDQISVHLIERIIKWNKENAMILKFSSEHFTNYAERLQDYIDNKINKYDLPFEFLNVKNDEIFLSCFQFINIFFVLLQIRFADLPNFEQLVRRFMDNWIAPLSSKQMKAPSLFPDYKSVLIVYNTFIKKNREAFREVYENMKSSNLEVATNKDFFNFLKQYSLLSPEKITQVSIFFRVCERFNDPYLSIYNTLKTEKNLNALSGNVVFQRFLNNFIQFDDFVSNLILYKHKKLYKAGNHFPKNEVVASIFELLKISKNDKKPKHIFKRIAISKNQKIMKNSTTNKINISNELTTSQEFTRAQEAIHQTELDNIKRELECMAIEDFNVLLVDNEMKQFSTAKNSLTDFKDSVPELLGNYNQAPFTFFV